MNKNDDIDNNIMKEVADATHTTAPAEIEGGEEDIKAHFVGGNERVFAGTVKFVAQKKTHPRTEQECFEELIGDVKNAVEQLCDERRCRECAKLIDEFNTTQKVQFTICSDDDLDIEAPPKLLTNNEIKDARDYERIVELAQKWEDFYILMLNILSAN